MKKNFLIILFIFCSTFLFADIVKCKKTISEVKSEYINENPSDYFKESPNEKYLYFYYAKDSFRIYHYANSVRIYTCKYKYEINEVVPFSYTRFIDYNDIVTSYDYWNWNINTCDIEEDDGYYIEIYKKALEVKEFNNGYMVMILNDDISKIVVIYEKVSEELVKISEFFFSNEEDMDMIFELFS